MAPTAGAAAAVSPPWPYDQPPGFSFLPTDQELITSYLARHVAHQPLPSAAVQTANVYARDPRELMGDSDEAYFFTKRKRTSRGSSRPQRQVGAAGKWRIDSQSDVKDETGAVIGHKSVLSFHKANNKRSSGWVMHEYLLGSMADERVSFQEDAVCHIRGRPRLDREEEDQLEDSSSANKRMKTLIDDTIAPQAKLSPPVAPVPAASSWPFQRVPSTRRAPSWPFQRVPSTSRASSWPLQGVPSTSRAPSASHPPRNPKTVALARQHQTTSEAADAVKPKSQACHRSPADAVNPFITFTWQQDGMPTGNSFGDDQQAAAMPGSSATGSVHENCESEDCIEVSPELVVDLDFNIWEMDFDELLDAIVM